MSTAVFATLQLDFDLVIRRAGNSLCISIPGVAARTIGWEEGDSVKMIVTDTEIVVRKQKAKDKK